MDILELLNPQEQAQLLGKKIKTLRLAKNISQKELAQKANISRKTIYNIEEGVSGSIEDFLNILFILEKTQDLFDSLELPKPNNKDDFLLHERLETQKYAQKRLKK